MYLKCISKVSIDTVKNVYIYMCIYFFQNVYIYVYIYTPKVSRYMYLDTLQHWFLRYYIFKRAGQ